MVLNIAFMCLGFILGLCFALVVAVIHTEREERENF